MPSKPELVMSFLYDHKNTSIRFEDIEKELKQIDNLDYVLGYLVGQGLVRAIIDNTGRFYHLTYKGIQLEEMCRKDLKKRGIKH